MNQEFSPLQLDNYDLYRQNGNPRLDEDEHTTHD